MDKNEVILYKLGTVSTSRPIARCLPLNIEKALRKRYVIFPDD